MTLKVSTASKNAALDGTGISEQFTLGFLYIFAGTEPATADAALDMVTDHTELVRISLSGGSDGLSFDPPAAGILNKAAAESWTGTCAFDGADDGLTTLTPTFYRFCAAGDDGRALADTDVGYRIQGTAGGPSSSADLVLGTATLTSGNAQPVNTWRWRIEG